jgi:hypothetical protein
MSEVTGHTSYKGYSAQQHNDAFEVFKNFLTEIRPKRIGIQWATMHRPI